MLKEIRLLLIFSVLSSCCGSAPTAPQDSAINLVPIGPQVLRILLQAPCQQGVIPLVYTRVNVATSANEWMATAGSAGVGSLTLTNAMGNICTGNTFSVSMFPTP